MTQVYNGSPSQGHLGPGPAFITTTAGQLPLEVRSSRLHLLRPPLKGGSASPVLLRPPLMSSSGSPELLRLAQQGCLAICRASLGLARPLLRQPQPGLALLESALQLQHLKAAPMGAPACRSSESPWAKRQRPP